MVRSRSCGRGRRAPVAIARSPQIRSAEEAVDLLLDATGASPPPFAAALLLDHDHRLVATVSGIDQPGHSLEELSEALADIYGHADIAAVVLGSTPTETEVCTWPLVHEARWSVIDAVLDGGGIHLLDWFVFVGGYALSVSELVLDLDPPWVPEPPR